MFEDSSAKYYQNNLERLQKKARERYQSLSKKEKEESNNMLLNDSKIYQKMKNKSLLSIERNLIKWKKMPYYNYKKLFLFFKKFFW